jgi:radical SAM superfamily enzyme YgiQ (UPF0313 family)
MRKILLIAPINTKARYSIPILGAKATTPPLSLATIAALTPDDIEVSIWDESVFGKIDDSTETGEYDLVGITGYIPHLPRIKQIAEVFRKRDTTVVIGGVGVSAYPEIIRGFCDVLFIGEAELTWPKFISDWKSGNYKKEYRQIAKPDLSTSPAPRWDSIADQMKHYLIGVVQTSRGCPFDCEFCDVIYLFGRRPRHKPVENVLKEIATIESLGMERIFICDDNFSCNIRYAKELLREIVKLNNSFKNPLTFRTQLSVNIAQDDELLELLADANFTNLFIGIETPNEESLKEANKMQNLRGDLVSDCKKIQSYGMYIESGMILGFDHDDISIFDMQFNFIQETCIPIPSPRLLKAISGTRLWRRLLSEGRLLKKDAVDHKYRTKRDSVQCNIIPKGMTRIELISGYVDLFERLYSWDNCIARIKGFISGIKRKPEVKRQKRKPKQILQVIRFLFSIDRETRKAVFDSLSYTRKHAPYMINKVMEILIQQYGYVQFTRSLSETMPEEIERERHRDVNQYIEQMELKLPANFEKSYEEVFPSIYNRVYTRLNDKECIDEVLVEIFTDFLTRWGQTFDNFSEHHKVFLKEIADRSIAKINSVSIESSSTLTQDGLAKNDRETADTILKAVEQELITGKVNL